MATGDYARTKEVEVSDSGTVSSGATISNTHVYTVRIVNGNTSKSGGGDIEINASNVSDQTDILLTDGSDTTLTYWWQKFDTTNDIYIAQVAMSGVTADNSVQMKVYYDGDGSATDDSSTESTVFDSATNLGARYALNSTGSVTDSTSNNIDSTSVTVTGTVSGHFDVGLDFDGNNDEVRFGPVGGTVYDTNNYMVMFQASTSDTATDRRLFTAIGNQNANNEYNMLVGLDYDGGALNSRSDDWGGSYDSTNNGTVGSNQIIESGFSANDGNVHQWVYKNNIPNGESWLYRDGLQRENDTDGETSLSSNSIDELAIGNTGREGKDYRIDANIFEYRWYTTHNIEDAWVSAYWDMSPAGGQVLFDQNQEGVTDTAVDTQFTFTPQTSTEAITRRDVATDTSFSFTPTTAEAFEDLTEFLNVANRAETELTGSITAEDRTIEVDDASVFPNPPFLVSIEASNSREIVKVNGNGASTLDECFRGREDTTAQDWDAGVTVSNRWTKGTYDRLVEELDERTQVLSANQSTAQADVDAGVVANIFENVEIQEAPYQVLSNSKIRIDETGQYEISYTVNFTQTGGGDREIMQGNIRVNGTDQTPETRSTCYIRNNSNGDKNSITNDHVVSLGVGDEVELFVEEQKGGVQTEITSASISVKKVA